MKRTTRITCLAGALIGAFAATVTTAAPTEAGSLIFNTAYSCHATGGSAGDYLYGVGNRSSSRELILRCDIETAGHQHRYADAVYVHGRDGTSTGRLRAQVCASYYDVVGGRCGANHGSATGDIRNVSLSIDPGDTWNNSTINDYSYLAIAVPPQQGSSVSSVFGFRVWWQ